MMNNGRWKTCAILVVGLCATTALLAEAVLSAGDWTARGRVRHLAGDAEGAATAYREALRLDPSNGEAQSYLARLEREGRGGRWRTRAELIESVENSWVRAAAGAPAAPVPQSDPGRAAMQARLEAIVVTEVEFAGARLSAVLATLTALAAEQGGAPGAPNIVLLDPGRRDPEVTLSLRGLSLKRTLDFVTEAVGFGYEVQPDAVVVRAADGAAPLETAVLSLSPAVAIRMAEAVRGGGGAEPSAREATEGGRPAVDSALVRAFLEQAGVVFSGVEGSSLVFDGSAILVTQTPRNLARVRAILERYNSVRQVEIEAKFLEVEDGVLEELGINWSASRRNDPVTGLPRERYLTGNRSVAEAFSGSATNGAISIDGQTMANVTAPVLPGAVPLAAGAKSLAEIGGVIGEFDVSATVRALAQKQGSDLLSAPKVTVLSGHSASITVARQLRYPRQFGQIQSQVGQTGGESSGSAGVTITAGTPQDFTTENIGVELQVTPVVEEDGHSITLDLHPVVTEFEGFVEYGGPSLAVSGGKTVTIPSGFYQPIFSRRAVSTRVTLWDGATLVMGGLTREETRKVNDKVPVLGDLPAIGRLFRSSGEGATKRNLLIFVTASLVGPGGGWTRAEGPAQAGGAAPDGDAAEGK